MMRGPFKAQMSDRIKRLEDEIERLQQAVYECKWGYYEITTADVGKHTLLMFGRHWSVSDFLGRIQPQDVGKRCFLMNNSANGDLMGDFIQIENNEQRDSRIKRSQRVMQERRREKLKDELRGLLKRLV